MPKYKAINCRTGEVAFAEFESSPEITDDEWAFDWAYGCWDKEATDVYKQIEESTANKGLVYFWALIEADKW